MSFRNSPVIGIGGLLRHGKDAVADHLVEKHGFVKVNMSTHINALLSDLNPYVPVRGRFGITRWLRYVDVIGERGFTDAKEVPEFRRLMQVFGGTVVRDGIDKEFWVNQVAREIDELRSIGRPVVLSGIRFPNECAIIREAGGTLLWVHRPSIVNAGAAASDQTETSIGESDFDRTVLNDGTLDDLDALTDGIVAEMLAGAQR